jgi:uncharacterized membrane protein YqjE
MARSKGLVLALLAGVALVGGFIVLQTVLATVALVWRLAQFGVVVLLAVALVYGLFQVYKGWSQAGEELSSGSSRSESDFGDVLDDSGTAEREREFE